MVFVKNCNTDHAFTYIINLFCLDSDKLNLNQYRKKIQFIFVINIFYWILEKLLCFAMQRPGIYHVRKHKISMKRKLSRVSK